MTLRPPTLGLPRASHKSAVTAQRFAQGMTFDQYVAYTGTPENLAREAGWWLGTTRHDFSGRMRTRYDLCRLGEAQVHLRRVPGDLPQDGTRKAMQAHAGVDRPGENREQAWERFIRNWGALQDSPFWQVWTSAAADEMLSALHERLVVGPSTRRDRAPESS